MNLVRRLLSALRPPPPAGPSPELVALQRELSALRTAVGDGQFFQSSDRAAYVERAHELYEARQMCGSGPWLDEANRARVAESGVPLKESNPLLSQGAYGDLELALQNVEWRREVNLSYLEFSRWGIQQIILISRLYYIKNPIIRRLVDVCAAYVFARGVEISSPDEAANDVIKEFLANNKKVLGQNALMHLERRKDYDGNLFFAFFPDRESTGKVKLRTIDATEVQDIITDPDDAETPWFYRRQWSQRIFDQINGDTSLKTVQAWYPALGYDPDDKPAVINGITVAWDTPVYHRKTGHVAQWHYGCPRIYPALDWAKAARRFLEACATVKNSLATIAMKLTTKGGQQAIEGIKQQLQTNVNAAPGNSLWDTNPPPVNASIFASGPGTSLEAFMTRGAGGDPEEVRQFKLQCCMVKGVPETFLSDVKTGNLATATSLDRPTETAMLELQESWIEDLTVICQYALQVSLAAPSGRLREAFEKRGITDMSHVRIVEMARAKDDVGRVVYLPLKESAQDKQRPTVEVRVQFPAIREGDIPAMVKATVEAMTLENKGGQTVGIDEKEGVRRLMDLLGFEDADELTESMYPDGDYDPNRAHQVVAEPIAKAQPLPGGTPEDREQPGDIAEAARHLRDAAAMVRANGRA